MHRFVLIVSCWLAACAGPADETYDLPRPEAPTLAPEVFEKVSNGEVTTDRPEVGRIGGCTATLVAPDVAITASHCVGYRTRTNLGNYNTMRITNGNETDRKSVV